MQGARRWAVVDSTPKPRNAADAPCRANPLGPYGFAFIRRCRLLIGIYPTSSAPPRLKANPSRSRPRGTLRQAPSAKLPPRLAFGLCGLGGMVWLGAAEAQSAMLAQSAAPA